MKTLDIYAQRIIKFFFPLMVSALHCWKKSNCPFTEFNSQRQRKSGRILTVWHGTVSGLWLGAVAAVCLICRLRCSTQSCRSCWFVHTTWSLSNIGPAGDGKWQTRWRTCQHFTVRFWTCEGWSYRSARTHFCGSHRRPVWSPSCWPEAVSPAELDRREAEC